MLTYDSSKLPKPTSASEEIWLPRSFFPPSRRIIKQAAAALYFEAFTASVSCDDLSSGTVVLNTDRLMACGPVLYRQSTAMSVSESTVSVSGRDVIASEKFSLLSKSQWTSSCYANAAGAFVGFYSTYENHVRRNPVETVGSSDNDPHTVVVSASASSEPLLVPYGEEDASKISDISMVRYLTNWGENLWEAIALACETRSLSVFEQSSSVPTVALSGAAASWLFMVDGGLLKKCVETARSVSTEPENPAIGRISVPKFSPVQLSFSSSR